MAVVAYEQAEKVLNKLIEAGHTATFMESRGGMLRQSQLTLFIALEKEYLEEVLAILRENSLRRVPVGGEAEEAGAPEEGSVQALVGGAAVFVWDLDRFEVC